MTFRVRGAGEAEDAGSRHGDGDAVRDDGRRDDVARVFVALVLPADRVGHAVAEMHARVAEPHARQRGREEHLRLRFHVVGILDGAREVLDGALERLEGEDVGDGVRALVCRSVDGVLWAGGAGRIRDSGPGFEAVTEDIEAGGGVDGRGHGAGVQGVADTEGWLQSPVGYACLCFLGDEVEDSGTGGFTASAGGGGDGDERGKGFGNGEASAAGFGSFIRSGSR